MIIVYLSLFCWERPVYTRALTGAVLFQFSRYPQFITVGYKVSVSSDIRFICKQLLVNCTAKLAKKLKIWLPSITIFSNARTDRSPYIYIRRWLHLRYNTYIHNCIYSFLSLNIMAGEKRKTSEQIWYTSTSYNFFFPSSSHPSLQASEQPQNR